MGSATSPPERFLHRFGGVSLESDRPVPDLPTGAALAERVVLEHGPVSVPPGGIPVHRWTGALALALVRAPGGWCFHSAEGHAFAVDAGGARIRCGPHPGAHEMLVRQVLPRVLHLRGRFVLHGSAVATPAGALAILGPSGAGKSTLAASLRHHLGWPLLADDALVLELGDGAPLLHPTSSRARLWPDSAARLAEGVASSRPLTRRPGKLECDLRGPAALEARPLHRILVLDLESGASPPARGVVQILQHQVRFHPADPAGASRQLALAARLAAQAPIESLCLPRDLERLPEVARELARRAA